MHGRKFGAKNGAVSRPQKWGREMDPVPVIQFEIKYRGCETATPKLGPPGGPNFGAANSSIFRLISSRAFHSGPTDKCSKRKPENHDRRRQLSGGRDHMRETCTGEALAREARIVEIFRPQIWSRANWQLLQTCVCTRYCKASGLLRPPEPSVMGFRSLPRPPEASLMGFRGLSRPREASTKSQNPFTLQDYEASGTRAYNTIRGVPARPRGPDEPWLPFFIHVKRIFSRSWLQVLFILTLFKTSRRTSKGPRPLKMILQKLFLLPQVLISDFSTGLK